MSAGRSGAQRGPPSDRPPPQVLASPRHGCRFEVRRRGKAASELSQNRSVERGLAFNAARIGALVAPDLTDDPDDAQGSSPESLLQFLSDHKQRSRIRGEHNQRLDKRRRTAAVFLGVLAAFALVAVNVLIWGNFTHLWLVSQAPAGSTGSRESQVTTSGHHNQAPSTPSHPGRGSKSPANAQPPKSIRFGLTAARDDSWVEIRADSSTGRVLFDGIVPKGQSIHLVGRRLWARFGSLGNFDLTINGRPVHPALNGTVDTVITASAVRPAPVQTKSG